MKRFSAALVDAELRLARLKMKIRSVPPPDVSGALGFPAELQLRCNDAIRIT